MNMKKLIKLGIVSFIISITLLGLFLYQPQEFKNKYNYVEQCPTRVFTKAAIVFDSVLICGTEKVPQEKLEHAAQVTAQWLDNNQDGISDNLEINKALKENNAVLLMSKKGFSSTFMIKLFRESEKRNMFGQDLYAQETNNPTRRDASQEEIHHLLTGAGWAKTYPDLFDDKSQTSKIYEGWKISDSKGYYNYNDPTCDAECKTMEHLYKSAAAYLNASSDLRDDEFTIKNSQELKEKLPLMVELFESNEYNYPNKMWPDGKYLFDDNIHYLIKN